jgi:predicted permease
VFIRALQKAASIERGFELSNVETAAIDLGLASYTRATGPRFLRDLMACVRALPGVEQATAAASLPTGEGTPFSPLTHPGMDPSAGGTVLDATANIVEPAYFATLRIPLFAGRDFDQGDVEGAPMVAIVSQEAARRFWPGESPVGKLLLQHPFRILGVPDSAPTVLRVIGVVGDTLARRQAARPQIYLSMQQQYAPGLHLLARSSHGRPLATEIRAVLSSLDANVPVLTAQTLEEAAALSLLPQRVAAGVSTALGGVGLLLAAMGIYAVTAFVVVARTREIGLRIALGATRTDVMGMILRQGLILVATGVSVGLVLAGASIQVLTRMLVGIPPIDPVGFALVAALFVAVGLLACYVPARHASRLEPLAAFKCE